MNIRFGYELVYTCPQPTPMILMLHAHPSRIPDLLRPDILETQPRSPARYVHRRVRQYLYANRCSYRRDPFDGRRSHQGQRYSRPGVSRRPRTSRRRLAARGTGVSVGQPLLRDRAAHVGCLAALRAFSTGMVKGAGGVRFRASTHCVWISFCSPDKNGVGGIYGAARRMPRLRASAITLLRCLNIPARYCTGYLGDIGVPVSESPMDFAGWLEAYLGGAWHTFDPRNNQRRIGRILMPGDAMLRTSPSARRSDPIVCSCFASGPTRSKPPKRGCALYNPQH